MCLNYCHCLRIKHFCCCFSLNVGCITIGWYLSLVSFLLLIASVAWVSETHRYKGGNFLEKSAYAVAGFWLLGASVCIITGVGKAKAMYLKCASVFMVVPIIGLAVNSVVLLYHKRAPKLIVNILPLVLMPYFIIVLCSKAADIEEQRRGYVSGRDSQMEIAPGPPETA